MICQTCLAETRTRRVKLELDGTIYLLQLYSNFSTSDCLKIHIVNSMVPYVWPIFSFCQWLWIWRSNSHRASNLQNDLWIVLPETRTRRVKLELDDTTYLLNLFKLFHIWLPWNLYQLYRWRLHHVIFIFTRRVEIRQSYDLLRNVGLRVL